MRRNIAEGAVAGLIGAVVAGLLLHFVTISVPDGGRMSLIIMTARMVRSNHSPAGWLVALVYGVVVGALFTRLVRDRTFTASIALVAGAFYGVGWWIVSELILAPAVLGVIPLSPVAVDLVRPVALWTMIASVLYGAVLGTALSVIATRRHRSQPNRVMQHTTRAA